MLLMVSLLIWGNWVSWAGPKISEGYMLKFSSKERIKNSEGWFGGNMRPGFLDMVHLGTLDEKLLPGQEDNRRLIVIGDVHGCNDERRFPN